MTSQEVSPLTLQGWEREKKTQLQESAVIWVLNSYFSSKIPRLIMWKAEFAYISKLQSGMIMPTVGCFQRSSPTEAKRPHTPGNIPVS